MKRMAVGLFLGLMMTMSRPAAGVAGPSTEHFCIGVHITPIVTKIPCDRKPDLDWWRIVSEVCGSADGYSIWMFVCAGGESTTVAGMEWGIQYNGGLGAGVDLDSWTMCGDAEFPEGDGAGPLADWPQSGTGNIVVWEPTTNCQRVGTDRYTGETLIAMGGVLNVFAYSPDQLIVTARPGSGMAKVVNCSGAEDIINGLVPLHLGIAGFCRPGYDPCYLNVAVQPSTWGRLKTLY